MNIRSSYFYITVITCVNNYCVLYYYDFDYLVWVWFSKKVGDST